MPRHLRRRTETLIPVTLRLLDETGRHRIAEPMLGIAVEVSGNDLRVSVMGRTGKPLSHGLARRQKVLVSFLATELHEKVESLVCELRSVAPIPRQPDAWHVRLMLPALMPDLAEEIITALQRYGRYPKRTVGWWTAAALALATGLGAWAVTSRAAEEAARVQRWQADRLRAQLAFSTRTVDELATSLEEADRQLEVQKRALIDAEDDRLALAALRMEVQDLERRLRRAERAPKVVNRVQMRGVSLTDFRAVRTIRGDATAPRLAYEDGTLEILGSVPEHQRISRMVGRLLGAYALVDSVDLQSLGSWSLESGDGRDRPRDGGGVRGR